MRLVAEGVGVRAEHFVFYSNTCGLVGGMGGLCSTNEESVCRCTCRCRCRCSSAFVLFLLPSVVLKLYVHYGIVICYTATSVEWEGLTRSGAPEGVCETILPNAQPLSSYQGCIDAV